MEQQVEQRSNAAWILVVASGVVAALHIWKLPSALPVIQEQLGFSLLVSGVLLGVVQVAGMLGGLAFSLLAEIISPRWTFITGLLLIIAGSTIGSLSQDASLLVATRIVEGMGVVMAAVMGPGLIRSHAPLPRLNQAVGWWAGYMGLATFIGLLATAWTLQYFSWQSWWRFLALLTVLPIPLLLKIIPPQATAGTAGVKAATRRILATASSGRVWLSGLIFGCYTVQWMAVVGFLPSIYQETGMSQLTGGFLSAVVGGLNAVGAIITGLLLQRGASGKAMLIAAFAIMIGTSIATFAVDFPADLILLQVVFLGLFSLCGAMIPATMTRVAVDLAPEGGSAPAAVGLMQQIFNVGNFTGPMIVAWLVVQTGGWNTTWWMTSFFGLVGITLTLVLARGDSPLKKIHS
ncbi:MFS transporter [Glutamicibacter sp. MNS18]|uniref:MFS transporter n=1 Tax=Glutamicibacter sp. MNS18 TaxID=2989817 RepID=UPI00223633C6|nr:MFS transporter [Glutamicibacter sp. MNS18]MCW4466758.1 MFS transporter [Glutamicibacter sp. MNS18]